MMNSEKKCVPVGTEEQQILMAVHLKRGKYYDQGVDTCFDMYSNLAA